MTPVRYGPYQLRTNLGEVGLFAPFHTGGHLFVCKELVVTSTINAYQTWAIASTGNTWWGYNVPLQGLQTQHFAMDTVVPHWQTITGLIPYGYDFYINVTFSGILVPGTNGRSAGAIQ